MRQRKTRGEVRRLSCSPSGRLLLGWTSRGLQVWDAQTLAPRQCIPGGDPAASLCCCFFQPGGQRFLQEQGYVSAEQDLPQGAPRPEHEKVLPPAWWEPGWVWQRFGGKQRAPADWCCFGPDGQTFLGSDPAGKSRHLSLWRFDGECVREFRWLEDWRAHQIVFAPDGWFLAAVIGNTYEARVADLQTGPPAVRALQHGDEVVRLAWSPLAPLLACAATRSVWLWDASTGERLQQLKGFQKTIDALAFSPDGSLLAAGSRDERARLWEVASGREKARLDSACGKVNALAFAPDGRTFAAACSRGIVVWDVG
jgi:WD40 repeat protein